MIVPQPARSEGEAPCVGVKFLHACCVLLAFQLKRKKKNNLEKKKAKGCSRPPSLSRFFQDYNKWDADPRGRSPTEAHSPNTSAPSFFFFPFFYFGAAAPKDGPPSLLPSLLPSFVPDPVPLSPG